jgi:histone H2A
MSQSSGQLGTGRHRKPHESYDIYIHRVCQQVCGEDNTMSQRAMRVIESMVIDLKKKLARLAAETAETTGSRTLSSRDIQAAVRLSFPSELSQHAVSDGTKAVTNEADYDANPTEEGYDRPRQDHAGIVFPIGRIHKYLVNGRYARQVGRHAPTYMAAVLEYVVAEVCEVAASAARDNRKSRITPRFIMLGVAGDEELKKLLLPDGAVIPDSGTVAYM